MWQRNGARVTVSTTFAYLPFPNGAFVKALCVGARNTGRSSVQINGWGLQLDDKRQIVVPNPRPWNKSTPHTLDGGHSQDWTMPFADFDGDLPIREFGVRSFVNLGSGEKVVGNRVVVKPEDLKTAERPPSPY